MRDTAMQDNSGSNVGLVLFLVAVYLAFVVWMYVSEPLLLAVFGAALTLIWLRDAGPRFLRKLAVQREPAEFSGEVLR
jgi:hypothetical protein